jgi:hypothetical protein
MMSPALLLLIVTLGLPRTPLAQAPATSAQAPAPAAKPPAAAPPQVPTVKPRPAAPARPPASTGDVTVKSSLDHTAMWVADRITYTIDFICRPGVEMLADDLAKEKLGLEGLSVVDADASDAPGPDGTTVRRYRFFLTTYQVDMPTLTIAPLNVRYVSRRPGQRPEDAVPAGEVRVPGATVAFRSVLPDDRDVASIRDLRPAAARRPIFGLLRSIGLGLVIVSIVPVLFVAVAVVRERRVPRPKRRSMRAVRQESRSSLDAVRAGDLTTVEGRREAFGQIDAIVREHLKAAFHLPGPNLTSAELAPAVAAAGAHVPVETLTSVLSLCEQARYGPPHAMPSLEICRETIDQAEQLVTKRG